MIALPNLLPFPEFSEIDAAIERALGDLDTLQRGGVDGVCVENDYDQPHRMVVGAEIMASFSRIAHQMMQHATVPVGVQVLLNDWRASLAIAHLIGAAFVRLDFFVDTVRISAGVVEPDADAVIAYRKQLGAEHIALFTDIQVKHSELLEPEKPLSVSARQAISKGSDALVVSGKITGEPPLIAHLQEARSAGGDFPVLIGSGATPENAGELLRHADGAIVGTSLKNSAAEHERIILERVQHLMSMQRR